MKWAIRSVTSVQPILEQANSSSIGANPESMSTLHTTRTAYAHRKHLAEF